MKRIPMLVPLVLLVMFPVWGDLGLDWSEVTGSANWSVRQGHSALAFNGKLWIIGGNGSGENGVRNDVWYSTDGAT